MLPQAGETIFSMAKELTKRPYRRVVFGGAPDSALGQGYDRAHYFYHDAYVSQSRRGIRTIGRSLGWFVPTISSKLFR